MASRTAQRWRPGVLLGRGYEASGVTPLAGDGLGEADAVAGGEHEVGVVEEPVDGRVGDGLGHELVEPAQSPNPIAPTSPAPGSTMQPDGDHADGSPSPRPQARRNVCSEPSNPSALSLSNATSARMRP